MRLAWCTPFGPESAIGRFSALVVDRLRSEVGWDVTICHPPSAGGRTWPDEGVELPRKVGRALDDHDLVVYNLGNHPGNHAAFLDWAAVASGIAIVHDVSCTHLMLQRLTGRSAKEISELLSPWYGAAAAAEAARAITTDPAAWAGSFENCVAFPLTELALGDMTGIVTHSEFAETHLRRRYLGNIEVLQLPALHLREAPPLPEPLPFLDDRIVILQAGVMNANKHIPTVVEGFARADIADRAQLVICGHGTERDHARVQAVIDSFGVRTAVHLLGEVSDGVLHALRERSAIAAVLRHPSLEAASASLLDSMAHGIAVITTDSAHYREMPAGTVHRIPAPPEAGAVANVLASWIADPSVPARIGARGRAHIEAVHTAQRYATIFACSAPRLGGAQRRDRLAAMVAANLRRSGALPDDPICAAVGATAAELFAHEPKLADQRIFGDAPR